MFVYYSIVSNCKLKLNDFFYKSSKCHIHINNYYIDNYDIIIINILWNENVFGNTI